MGWRGSGPMLRPDARPMARWGARLLAGLLCLSVGLPLAATALAQTPGAGAHAGAPAAATPTATAAVTGTPLAAGPGIAITGVDSKNFPTVSTNLTVSGNNGLPLVGLTASNFTVTEDGQPVAPGSLVLSSDISQQLNLVLAIDVSDSASDLSQVIAAVNDFIATLGPNDQVALISYYDTVTVVQSFTSDKTTLTTAVGQLTAGGNGTAFNQAADQAVNLLAALPAGRKAVIMFTNSGDTANNLSPETTLTNAAAATVHIYPIAYGNTVNPTLMRNWARFSGGQAYLLANATEVRPNLLTLGVLMRQAYKLSFKSGLPADNKAHAIIVSINAQGQSAQTQGSYTALPGQVQVVGPGLSNGQTVRGRVFLIADVNAPAPVISVTFQLDQQTLVTLTAPPYRFDWDSSSASPGLHTLTIKAIDQVGNQGQSQTSVNVVLPPVQVVTATPVKAVATAQAQAKQPNPITSLQAKALPVLGRVAGGLALLVGALVAFLLWLFTLRSMRQVQVKTCSVEVANEGNVRSRYELRAEDPTGMLKFEFMLNDTDLATRAGEPVEVRSAAVAAPAAGQAAPAEKTPNATIEKAKGAWTKATEVERKAVNTVDYSSMFSTWIVTISYLLPGGLGDSLRNSMSGLFNTQYQVRNVVDAPGRYQRMVTASAPPPMGGNPDAPLNRGNQLPATWSKTGTNSSGSNGAAAGATAAAPARPVARSGWSLTPPVDAGETLAVQLKVRPARFPRSKHYSFLVLSRAVDGSEETPITDHGSVALRGGSIFRRVLSWLFLAAAVVLLVVLAWYLLLSVGLIR